MWPICQFRLISEHSGLPPFRLEKVKASTCFLRDTDPLNNASLANGEANLLSWTPNYRWLWHHWNCDVWMILIENLRHQLAFVSPLIFSS